MKKIIFFSLMTLLAFNLTGCYRMPTDDDYCVVPTTNNRDITRERTESSHVPQVNY